MSEEIDPAPEQWRSQCLVARIQRDAAHQATRQWIEAWDRYGDGASLMHPRLTMAITAARKSLPGNVDPITPPPTDPRFARFGEAMWKFITKKGDDFCGEEISEDVLPLAQAAGLCCRVEYDPEIHGENIEADPGDKIWWWGDFDGAAGSAITRILKMSYEEIQRAIDATHPEALDTSRSIDADELAMMLVHNRHGKREIVNLIRWIILDSPNVEPTRGSN